LYADDQPMILPAVIEAKLQQILQPLTIPRPVTQPPLNVKPKLNFATHPSAKQLSPELPPNRPATLAFQRSYGSESNLLDSISSADDTAVSGDLGSWQRTGSVPDLLSPRLVSRRSEEPPPLPPERPTVSSEKPDTGGIQPSYYDIPAVDDAFYNTPTYPYSATQPNDAAEFYNVPPTAYLSERDNVEGTCYDVPPTDETDKKFAKKARKKQSEQNEITAGEVYNVPVVHMADNSRISVGNRDVDFYENVPSSSGKKLTSSICPTDQTYDIPPAEQEHGKSKSHNEVLSANTAGETYDTPPPKEVRGERVRPQMPVDKPSANISDPTYDTPPASESVVKTRPHKPQRIKPRPSLEQPEGVQLSEQLSGQETYDVPPSTVQHPVTGKPTSAARSQQQSTIATDEMYDVPPAKSLAGHSSSHIVVSNAADFSGGLSRPGTAEEQTYNVPASCVPAIPAKRNPVPPPKPPRPSQSLISTTDTSGVLAHGDTHDTLESELSEKDTVGELPSYGMKGAVKYRICSFVHIITDIILETRSL